MVLTALRGAAGFLTRIPVGQSEAAWRAFAARPAMMVPVGYAVGLVGAITIVLLPGPTAAVAYPAMLLGLTGIAHLDGLADLADASVVHGPVADRRAVMQDTVTGVGGTVAIGLSLIALALAALALVNAPIAVVVGIVVAAEVGAKLAMVLLSVLGEPGHRGLGSTMLGAPPTQGVLALVLASPAAVIAWPSLVSASALAGALVGAGAVAAVSSRLLGGISGDVFGATNEVARVVALHAGVVLWMHC